MTYDLEIMIIMNKNLPIVVCFMPKHYFIVILFFPINIVVLLEIAYLQK